MLVSINFESNEISHSMAADVIGRRLSYSLLFMKRLGSL